jgi:hypothetical protein
MKFQKYTRARTLKIDVITIRPSGGPTPANLHQGEGVQNLHPGVPQTFFSYFCTNVAYPLCQSPARVSDPLTCLVCLILTIDPGVRGSENLNQGDSKWIVGLISFTVKGS